MNPIDKTLSGVKDANSTDDKSDPIQSNNPDKALLV
jgi:hypothetical protein